MRASFLQSKRVYELICPHSLIGWRHILHMTIEVTSFIVFSGICVAAVLLVAIPTSEPNEIRHKDVRCVCTLCHVISRQSLDVALEYNVIVFRETFRIANRVWKMNGFSSCPLPYSDVDLFGATKTLNYLYSYVTMWSTVWHCLSSVLRRNMYIDDVLCRFLQNDT